MYQETEIHPLTLEMILFVVKKFPKKKAALKEYLVQNLVEQVEDLTEDQALEILEMMDSASFVKVEKQKKEEALKKYHENLIEEIEGFLKDNQEDYIVLAAVPDCYLVAKRINIIVQTKNDNSVFQPYETVNERQYFINVLVKTSDNFQPNGLIEKFMTRGCRMVKIYDLGAVVRVFNGIT